jgi:anthranilate/para-aminobenzoate synthase component I
MSQQAYFDMVTRSKAYIEAGDIFQVVVSQRFNIDYDLPAFDLYRALRRVNPSPYLFFLNMRDFSIVGSSPEVLVGVKNRQVNIRLTAGFPAGTVSGAPKIRAMEIIDELEPERRGVYAGCVGYFSANGDMDTCIALRTALIKDGKLYVQAGGGVVYDSTPQYEYDETVNKAAALFRAAEVSLKLARERKNR